MNRKNMCVNIADKIDKMIEDKVKTIINIDDKLKEFTKSDIFTPDNISKKMASYLSDTGNILEPSVGDGQLLKYIKLDNYERVDIYDIKEDYLNKCPEGENINKYNKDFLMEDIEYKYDNIILNPPYIKIQDLSEKYREYIREKWNILNKGNLDIYYAFILKCLNLLNEDGIMVCITPNSYLYNKSSLKLRKYLIENKLIDRIIDYKSEKVFDKVSTYCCITVFSKKNKDNFIYNDENIKYVDITNKEYNIFNKSKKDSITIGDICNIKNGIATLRDKIFIHKEKLYNEPCWKTITNGDKNSWCIFPYNNNGEILNEDIFKRNNPKTYKYLEDNKEELSKRDKGKKIYPKWYAYGRTQSLVISNKSKVLYIPTFCDPENLIYNILKPQLHIGCLCIEVKDDKYKIEFIKKVLEKNKEFIIRNSSKRGGGWLNISSSILKQISIN